MAADDAFLRAAQLYCIDADLLRRLHARDEAEVPRNAELARQARALGFGERPDALPLQRRIAKTAS